MNNPFTWEFAVVVGAIILLVLLCAAALGWHDGKKERKP